MTPSSNDNTMIVRTRFAPSPSGHLHIGGARTALFCRAFAHGNHGKFILRIEDTDQKRSSEAASNAFLEHLRWLGITWDEGPLYEGCGGGNTGPYFQSKRLHLYNKYLDQLIDEGHAYRAFETPDELAAQQAEAKKASRNYRYNRAALKLSPDEMQRMVDEGRPFVVRLKVPDDREIVIHDEVLGESTVPAGEIDDFVIRKADGFPTYHFAVVVDDELMGVTHVLRAQEHHKNTAKHLLIQDVLHFRRPVYGHMPLMCNPDGSKMSKRDKDKTLRKVIREREVTTPPPETISPNEFENWLGDKKRQLEFADALNLAEALRVSLPEINVDDFRRSGYLPSVLCNFLALNGWSPGKNTEKFDMDFLVQHFDLKRVMKAPARFDRNKLLAFNLDALQDMDEGEFLRRLREHAQTYRSEFVEKLNETQFSRFARASQPRSKTLDDPFRDGRFFIVEDDAIEYEETKAARKALVNGEPNGYAHLANIAPILAALEEWTVDAIEHAVKTFADEYANGKLGTVAQPLRIAVSGGTISPAIFDTLAILGKDSVMHRIERCLSIRRIVQS